MQSRMVNPEIRVTLGARHKAKTKQKTENLKDEQHELGKKKAGLNPCACEGLENLFLYIRHPPCRS